MKRKIVSVLIASGFLLSINNALAESITQDSNSLTVQNLDLSPLRNLNVLDNPMDKDYNYHQAFKKLDVNQLKKDMASLLTQSQDWWPADYGNYGPFFIRLSWHDAGTYRMVDGKGGANRGQQRFSPLNSWPDNVSLDKARQLLWPLKQKYGNAVSWSDLIVLAGTVSLESMGMKPIGFAFGREDDWQGDDTNWGVSPEVLSSNVKDGKVMSPFSATQMGLIYVNPEGPDGKPDRVSAVSGIRQAFGGMGMTDEETVALIAGGHSFGKAHGAAPSGKYVGAAPDKAPLEQQGLGWQSSYKSGKGQDAISSGLEGAWVATPTMWNHDYLTNLYTLNWEPALSPGGAHQWAPSNAPQNAMTPDAFESSVKYKPIMFTTDLALKEDPIYNKYAEEFYKDPQKFQTAFANAWFKLTHRDMGPKSRYMGPLIPNENFIWQDPTPKADYKQVSQADITQLKNIILKSGLSDSDLIKTAWASASTYRKSDYRGGSNGARISLSPEKDWAMNEPAKLDKVLSKLKSIQSNFNNSKKDGTKVSLADLIVLAGNTAIEDSAKKAGYNVKVPFTAGRTDATQQQTDVNSFNYLKTKADGFTNYTDNSINTNSLPQALVEKASMLDLNTSEMTVLVGGLRVLGANYQGSKDGVFTSTPGQLNNAFFVNLLDMSTVWKLDKNGEYVGYDRKSGKSKWTASSVDLIFGYNSELKAVAQVYAENGNQQKFVNDFVKAWNKVMMLGRFDIQD